MNYSQIQPRLDFASKIALIITGFVIPISVTGFGIALTATILLSLLANDYRAKFKLLLHNPIVILSLFLFILLVISISYSTGPWHDIFNALQKYSKLLYIIFLLPLFKQDAWKRAGINAFLAAMIVTLIASFMKMFGWINNPGGLGTIFTNHINTGFMMAFATFIVAHRCFEMTKWRWVYWILLVIMIINLFFMNEGRTGYWVFASLLVLFLWQKLHWKGLVTAIILLPIFIGALFVFSSNFKHRIDMIGKDIGNYHQQQLKYNSIGLRLVFTKNSLELIRLHPIVGTGVGSFRTEYQKHFPPAPDFENMSNPQNEYLMIGVQLGLIGLFVLFWLFYYQWRLSFVLPIEFRNLAQGMVIAFMAGSLCDTFLYLAITGYFFVYFTSLFYAKDFRKKVKNW